MDQEDLDFERLEAQRVRTLTPEQVEALHKPTVGDVKTQIVNSFRRDHTLVLQEIFKGYADDFDID